MKKIFFIIFYTGLSIIGYNSLKYKMVLEKSTVNNIYHADIICPKSTKELTDEFLYQGLSTKRSKYMR